MPPDGRPQRVTLAGAPARGARLRSLATWFAPWALTAAGAAAPIVIVLASGHTLVWRDTARLFAPLRGVIVEALRGLHLPLWNPYEGGGMPLFAQVLHGVLHPVSLLAAALAPGAGLDLFIAIYVVSSAVGTAALARSLGASRPASVTAGLSFGLSGYALSMAGTLPYLAGAANAPWIVAALVRARSHGGLALAACAVALGYLAGDAQWVVVAAALGVFLAAEARGRRGVATATLAVLLGTGLAAVQIVPTWSFLQETVRGRLPLPAEERAQWALSAWRLVELFSPGFFQGRPGALDAPVYAQLGRAATGFSFFAGYSLPFVASVFVGAATLALALAGWRTSRRATWLAIAAAVCLWVALGRAAGAEQALYPLPVWGSFRYAEKMTGPVTLCLALLAASGVDRMRSSVPRGVLLALVGLAGSAAALAAVAGTRAGVWAMGLLGGGPVAPLAASRLSVGLAHAAVALAALAALAAAARRSPQVRAAFGPLAGVLVFAQSLAAAPFAVHAGTRGAVDEMPLGRLAGRADVVRVGVPLRSSPGSGPAELDEIDRSLAVESRMGVAPFNAPARIDQIESYTGHPPWRLILAENAIRWDWLARRRYGLTHVVLRDPAGQGEAIRVGSSVRGGRPLYRETSFGFTVWEVPHRPWASFAEAVVSASGEQEAMRLLQQAVTTGSADVVLEGASPGPVGRGRVVRVDRRPEVVRIEAEADGDAILVVNDAWWPGWIATIDGHPAVIERADVLVRAVRWPSGRHVLEMRYEPPELRAGAWLSAAAAIVTAALAALGWQRSRRGSPPAASARPGGSEQSRPASCTGGLRPP